MMVALWGYWNQERKGEETLSMGRRVGVDLVYEWYILLCYDIHYMYRYTYLLIIM
jgi:hypothetical protein